MTITSSWISLSSWLRSVKGWRRAGTAFVFGSAMALTMPPFNLFPLLWFCLPALVFLLQGATSYKQAFAIGWIFAFGFFVFGLYWIAASMFVDIRLFWWAVPLSVAGLPAFFAIYYGIAGVIARRVGLSGLTGALSVGLLWFAADFARGYLFTGFPWNLIGYAWSGVLPVMQIVSVTGIYGLSLFTAIAACLPACLSTGAKSARVAVIASLFFFALLAIGGEARLQITSVGTVPKVRLRLVQPNIPQSLKWQSSTREANFQKLLDLTATPAAVAPTHIFWPETASTFYLNEDDFHRARIAAQIPAAASVITGVIRREQDDADKMYYYNSLVVVDGLGRLMGGYDKSHLVPFGEFMPWRRFIPIRTLANSGVDFTPGSGVRSLRVLGLPLFSPLICYEAIFPGQVVDENDRPDFMVNLTNDGWYGNTTGPYQHFAIVRVRAIEEGLPLVRVANTGISGVIDPMGRITHRLGLEKQGFIDSDLPAPLPPTIFSRHGQGIAVIFFIIIAFIVMLAKHYANKKI